MKKRIALIGLALITVLSTITLASFTSQENFAEDAQDDNPRRYSSASILTDDGWLYVFDYTEYANGIPDDIIDVYNFQGINLRYQSHPDYYLIEHGNKHIPSYLRAGWGSKAEQADMHLINNEILTKDKTPEELLALNPDDYEFHSIDKEMFFSLMREALTKETVEMCDRQPHLDGKANGPAFLMEPEFTDGYRFQAAFYNTVLACETDGCVQHLYIDLQYETEDGFVQLSDLVEQGTATEEQLEVHQQLQAITDAIKEQDDFTAEADAYSQLAMDGVEFSRLAPLLISIAEDTYSIYRTASTLEAIS